jgi:rhodanese-related sulfurtransferase
MQFANASMLGLAGFLFLCFGSRLAVAKDPVSLSAVVEATFVCAAWDELLVRAPPPEELPPQPATNADAINTANDKLRLRICRHGRRASAAAGALAGLIIRM